MSLSLPPNPNEILIKIGIALFLLIASFLAGVLITGNHYHEIMIKQQAASKQLLDDKTAEVTKTNDENKTLKESIDHDHIEATTRIQNMSTANGNLSRRVIELLHQQPTSCTNTMPDKIADTGITETESPITQFSAELILFSDEMAKQADVAAQYATECKREIDGSHY